MDCVERGPGGRGAWHAMTVLDNLPEICASALTMKDRFGLSRRFPFFSYLDGTSYFKSIGSQWSPCETYFDFTSWLAKDSSTHMRTDLVRNPRFMLSAVLEPCLWSHANNRFEHAGEMALICKPRGCRHHRKICVSFEQEFLRSADSGIHKKTMRRHAGRSFEHSSKVRRREIHQTGNLRE